MHQISLFSSTDNPSVLLLVALSWIHSCSRQLGPWSYPRRKDKGLYVMCIKLGKWYLYHLNVGFRISGDFSSTNKAKNNSLWSTSILMSIKATKTYFVFFLLNITQKSMNITTSYSLSVKSIVLIKQGTSYLTSQEHFGWTTGDCLKPTVSPYPTSSLLFLSLVLDMKPRASNILDTEACSKSALDLNL